MIVVLFSRSNFTMAGLLTFPDLNSFPPKYFWTVEIEKFKSFFGITAAGTVLDFHQIPF